MADKEKEKKESHAPEGAGAGYDTLFWLLLFLVFLYFLNSFFQSLGINFSNFPRSLAVIFEAIFNKVQVFSVFLSLLFFSGLIYVNLKV